MNDRDWNIDIEYPDDVPVRYWYNWTMPLVVRYLSSNGSSNVARLNIRMNGDEILIFRKYHLVFSHNEDTVFVRIRWVRDMNPENTNMINQQLVDMMVLNQNAYENGIPECEFNMSKSHMDYAKNRAISTIITRN